MDIDSIISDTFDFLTGPWGFPALIVVVVVTIMLVRGPNKPRR